MKITKALISIILIVSVFSMGCASSMVIGGKKVSPYGLFNANNKQDDVQYKTSTGSLIWGILGVETIFFPVYFLGFNLYEPVGEKKTDQQK